MGRRLGGTLGALMLAAFVLLATLVYGSQAANNRLGDDLAVGYIACRMLAEGKGAALYDHSHSGTVHEITAADWDSSAARYGFTGTTYAYVQTPLWAYALTPACTTMNWPAFAAVYAFIATLAVAGIVWLSARYLANGSTPLVMAFVLVTLWYGLPFKYAMYLLQTHALILIACLGALLLAERKRPVRAGLLLAMAATVKITPALLVVYWIANRRWKALAAFTISMGALFAITYALAGGEMTGAFISELRHFSSNIYVAFNNQSVAAGIMAPQYPQALDQWLIYPLTPWVKIVTGLLGVAFVGLAGHLRHKGASEGATVSVALLAMTAFAPLAWTHYYIVCIVPLIWLGSQPRMLGFVVLAALAGMLPHIEFRALLYTGLLLIALCLYKAMQEGRHSNSSHFIARPSTSTATTVM